MGTLDGLKVLDLTRNAPGQLLTMLLGDAGADVLLIEEVDVPRSGWRSSRNEDPKQVEQSLAYTPQGRNKRSMTLNLKDPRGRKVFHELAADADAVIEGFRPGVMARLGVDHATLAKINPRIVVASITGFGQTGPHSTLPGHDINYIAEGGLLSLLFPDPEGPPFPPLNLVGDYAGGTLMGGLGLMMALYSAQRTGKGQHVDMSMTDGVTQLLAGQLSRFFQTGESPVRGRQQISGQTAVFYNTYRCKDGRWYSIGSIEPYFYEDFCRAIGKEEWVPLQGADEGEQAKMIAEARNIFATRTQEEWEQHFRSFDICAAPVRELRDLPDSENVRARNMVLQLDHPALGPVKQVGFGLKFSATPSSFRNFAPRRGEHTEAVLGTLGYGQDEVAELRKGGVIL